MSALTALDTSQHTTPLSNLQLPNNQLTAVAKEIDEAIKSDTPNVAALDKDTPKVDLSSYYSNVQAPEFHTESVQAGQNLSNAIATAVTHGMDPQDAVNIQRAKAAYESTMKASQTSTFELKVE